ncbi:MAG: hypothetical protein QG608_3179 [Actinomycetota bacterium]|nr:hypothetical protein [Actinomycetota bacterium]
MIIRVRDERALLSAPPSAAVTDLASVTAEPHIVFRSTARDSTYGKVGVTTVEDPDGPRAILDLSCDRVFTTAKGGLCLMSDRGVVTRYKVLVLDESFQVVEEKPLPGMPKEGTVSQDGTLASTTTIVNGQCDASGSFTTRTTVWRIQGSSYGALEDFALYLGGERRQGEQLNVWGVTFAGDDTFYATAGSGKRTWLVRGSLSGRRLDAIREDAECPTLSPDGNRLVYRKREGASDNTWRLAVYDLRTGTERMLPSVPLTDDEVEWLDDDHIVYGLSRTGGQAAMSDIWSVAVDGAASPRLLVPAAFSPAVVREARSTSQLRGSGERTAQ